MPLQPPSPPKPEPPIKGQTAKKLYELEWRIYELQLAVEELLKGQKVQ